MTSRQIIEDLIEWLKPLKDKMLSHMAHWKPSCFLVDDAPQELKALQLVLHIVPTLCLFLYMFLNIFHKMFNYFKCILCCTNPIHSWWFYCICIPIKVVWGYGQGFHLPLLLACFQSMMFTWYQKKSKMWKCVVESSKTFMMWCTCP